MFGIVQWVIQAIGAVIVGAGGLVFAFGKLPFIGMILVFVIVCFIWGGLDKNRKQAKKYRERKRR